LFFKKNNGILCSALKLSSGISARVVRHVSQESSRFGAVFEQKTVIEQADDVLRRVKGLRAGLMGAMKVNQEDPDYARVFNSLTCSLMDMIHEEWSLSLGADGKQALEAMTGPMLKHLLDVAVSRDIFQKEDGGSDLGDLGSRHKSLVLLSLVPRIYLMVCWFDYFQKDRWALVKSAAAEIVKASESYLGRLSSRSGVEASLHPVLVSCVSMEFASLFFSVYRQTAELDIAMLRDMHEDDRSIFMAGLGQSGMDYSHLIANYRTATSHMMELVDVLEGMSVSFNDATPPDDEYPSDED
jgi:hypothetical protein